MGRDEIKAVRGWADDFMWWQREKDIASVVAVGNIDADAAKEFGIWRHYQGDIVILNHDGSRLNVIATGDPLRFVTIVPASERSGRILYTILDREIVRLALDGTA